MQTLDLDTAVSSRKSGNRQDGLKLIIANKNYSSWSMRPWLVLMAFGIPFEEIRIVLDRPDTASRIAEFCPSGRVPLLIAGSLTIWDSLAICEYLAEQYPEKGLWPQDRAARAMARSVCAEMHAGFTGLRSAMPMNLRLQAPGQGRTPAAQADIGRICEIWEDCLSRFGHHRYLFGEFSIADAYYAPVVMRFKTYNVALAPALQAYCERVASHPALAEWCQEALLETETHSKYDVPPA